MIVAVAILLGCYVLFRIVDSTYRPDSRPMVQRFRLLLLGLTGIVAVAVIADAVARAWSEHGIIRAVSQAFAREETAPTQVAKESGLRSQTSSGGPFEISYPHLGARKIANTSMSREWIVIHNPAVPVQLNKDAGIKVIYKSGSYSGDYRWTSDYSMKVDQAISAAEIRFLLLDVWGQRVETLKDEIIEDVGPGTHKSDGEWRLFPENDALRFYASIAYVARVRLRDGRIVEADEEQVLEEVRKFAARFKPEDLEPVKPAPATAAANR